MTIIEVVLQEQWKKLDWGHVGENVPRGKGNSMCAQLVGGVLLQKGRTTCSHSWGEKWWKGRILRWKVEHLCAGGCDPGEGRPEHR